MIGGLCTTGEIDETKITKRKSNVGRVNDSHKEWLVGGICRETKGIFLIRVERRDSDTLMSVITENVLVGTRLATDCWRGYSRLAQVRFTHGTGNHSSNFLNSNNALIHTLNVENLWRWLKEYLKQKSMNRVWKLNENLVEYVFRRKHPNAFEFINN
uniref:ISXO2-like transposase domain-containing protein n=1 Tax=Anopheles atroparvus TaxID=41427 RepID=A0A182IWX9_ANOAO